MNKDPLAQVHKNSLKTKRWIESNRSVAIGFHPPRFEFCHADQCQICISCQIKKHRAKNWFIDMYNLWKNSTFLEWLVADYIIKKVCLWEVDADGDVGWWQGLDTLTFLLDLKLGEIQLTGIVTLFAISTENVTLLGAFRARLRLSTERGAHTRCCDVWRALACWAVPPFWFGWNIFPTHSKSWLGSVMACISTTNESFLSSMNVRLKL